jgi:DNA-binding beta-propeller fold protein YncE
MSARTRRGRLVGALAAAAFLVGGVVAMATHMVPGPLGAVPRHARGGNGAATDAPESGRIPVLFVGNAGDGTISLIRADTLAVVRTLSVTPDGAFPHDFLQALAYPAILFKKGKSYVQGIAVSPDGRTVYASRGYLGDVVAIDIATDALRWRLPLPGLRADHLALAPDGRRLFVAATTANAIEVVDTSEGRVVGSFAAGTYPHVVRIAPNDRTITVGSLGDMSARAGHEGERRLTIFDIDTYAPVRSVSFDAGVRPFAFSPDGAKVYVQLSFLHGFRVVDMATGATEREVTLPVGDGAIGLAREDYPNQAAHHGIALSADATTICEAATISNYVTLLDRRTLEVIATIPGMGAPAEAETSLDGRYCFVTNRDPHINALSVISYTDRREVARIPVGLRPQEMTEALVPATVLAGAENAP